PAHRPRPGPIPAGGRHLGRADAQPLLRLPRLLHPGGDLRVRRDSPLAGPAPPDFGAARAGPAGRSALVPCLVSGPAPARGPAVANRGEPSPALRPWAIGAVFAICLMIGTLWIVGARAPWSPDFTTGPIPARITGAATGPVAEGGRLFYDKGCQYCHAIAGYGGARGPDLSAVGDRLTPAQMTWRILNGGTN